MRRLRRPLMVLFAVVLWSLTSHGAQFIELTVDVETILWMPADEDYPAVIRTTNESARCVVGTNGWLIESGTDAGTSAWWFTGSNLVHRTTTLKSPFKDMELYARNHGGPSTMNLPQVRDEEIAVTDGNLWLLPKFKFAGRLETLVWMAFCSGRCIKTEEPVKVPVSFTRTWECVRKARVFKDALGLPTTIDVCDTNGSNTLLQYRLAVGDNYPFEDGSFTSTNVLGWNFPLEFHSVNHMVVSNYLMVSGSTHGKLRSIRPTSRPQLSPR